MAPEYATEGLFSEKSDVFSFGVLLLEIVSGRRISNFYDNEDSLSLLGFVSLQFIGLSRLFVAYTSLSFKSFMLVFSCIFCFPF